MVASQDGRSAPRPGPGGHAVRLARLGAWVAAATIALLLTAAATLAQAPGGSAPEDMVGMIPMVVFAVVGALIVSHRHGNAIGWVMIGAGAAFVIDAAAVAYVEADAAGWDLPATVWAAWLASWVWSLGWSLAFGWLPFLFPDGRLLSRRWRWLGVALAVGTLQFIPAMLLPTLEYGDDEAVYGPNPIGIESAGPLLEGIVDAFGMAFVFVWLATMVMLVLRYRRADRVGRLQLRWFLFSVMVVIGSILLTILPTLEDLLAGPLSGLTVAIIPLSVGIAVTRYRLYEIDRIVSRAVTFTVVVGLLVGLYALGVLAAGALLEPVAPDSDLAVALATLLAAAAFRPLLARVRARVDRRFNRARYDATTEIASFGQRLRDELDLAELRGDLAATAVRTMQPTSASVWVPGG